MNTRSYRISTFAMAPLWATLSVVGIGGCAPDDPTVVEVFQGPRGPRILSLEEFVAASTFEGPRGRQYMVEGDIPLRTLEDVEAYYHKHYAREIEKLSVRVFNGADDAWSNNDQVALEYCVSAAFPASGTWSRTNTLTAMATAAQRWKDVANIDFRYIPERDADCLSGSSIPHNRFFKVAPSPLANAFACAFWPVSRVTCPELDGSTVGADTSATPPLSITRTLTHELGHVLGMIHEYQRDDAPDTSCGIVPGRDLTSYDSTSIMQASLGSCGGSPMEELSALDGFGMRELYGMPPAWITVVDSNLL